MDIKATTQILMRIKALWQDQYIDPLIFKAWHEELAQLDAEETLQAIRERIQAGMARPSCAELYREASAIREQRLSVERERRPKVEYQQSAAERERNLERFQEILARLKRGIRSVD
ncbi:MAG TPA: hypothetical protein VH187_01430 [Scandinavium sp.]|jgi:hypothetical protein|uniref:hypothetical protein n=1 Tax=Scandinavium sp. TaxID=2830653 RepID=UPI002E332CA2|nr:hypothetical protein [Scandinavium sp.]HEX4499819.1 hypothetical protein [Scandinavium sp.]